MLALNLGVGAGGGYYSDCTLYSYDLGAWEVRVYYTVVVLLWYTSHELTWFGGLEGGCIEVVLQ